MPRAAIALFLISLAAASAHAASCVPAVDDTGCFTTDGTHSKCEQKAGKNAAKMAQGVLKCHQKMADAAFKAVAFDEETCEATAIQKFFDKTDVTDCSCVDKPTLASDWETSLDALNGTLYCDAGAPFGGDNSGNVPTTKDALKCEDGLNKCVAKLVKDYTKCHASAAKAAVKGTAFDEEACEEGPIPGKPGKAAVERFNACTGKVTAKGGCAGCENTAGHAFNVDALIDSLNNLVYCEDQGGGACPTTYEFTDAASGTDQDLGWTGLAHDQTLTSNVRFTLGVSDCANPSPPCGTCTLSGPVANGGGATFANHRCRGDNGGANGSWIACTSDADCSGTGNACLFFLGPPQPFGAGGVSFCQVSSISGVSGTLDPTTGAATFAAALRSALYGGPTVADPCPRCIAGVCSGGARSGMSCTIQGTSSLFADAVSLDCPPSNGLFLGDTTSGTTMTTSTQTVTVSAASPACTGIGWAGFRCLCDTCGDLAAEPCRSNADCPGGVVCGGKRCLGGSNAGAACAANSECPGGVCSQRGAFTQPNQCDDGVCTPNTPPDNDSSNEGTCAAGPMEKYCVIESFRGCLGASDCPASGDSCGPPKNRECFTDNGTISGTASVAGVASPTAPTFGALFCAPPTQASAVNTAYGFPGLGRLTIPGTAVMN